ncbi:hypothetical protein ABH994_003828 [Bradyrhizobium yuanmingense]
MCWASPVCCCAVLPACALAQRTAGAAGTRPSLRPLGYEGGVTKQSSGEISRENAKACLHLHTRCHRPRRRAIQYAETAMIETRGHGVLDSLPSQETTSVIWRTQRRLTLSHCERSDLSAEAFGESGINPESFRGGILDCFVARAPRNDEEESAGATLRSRAPDAAQRPPGDAKHRPVRRYAAEPPPIYPQSPFCLGSRLCAATPHALQLVRDTSDVHRFAWGRRRLTPGMPACRPERMFFAFRKISGCGSSFWRGIHVSKPVSSRSRLCCLCNTRIGFNPHHPRFASPPLFGHTRT